MTTLELRRVSKSYLSIPAVQDVSFTVEGGEATGYLGPNGSGKSTTLKMITGLIQPDAGEILLDGESIARDPMGVKNRIGYVPEEAHLYTHLSGSEHLRMIGQLRGLSEAEARHKADGFLALFNLAGDRHAPIAAYSKGMRQKVLLAAALLHNPDVLLFDEPFTGLDVNSALILRDLISRLAQAGKLVLFSSHELDTVERVCSRVIILHKGRVAADDSTARLRELTAAPDLESVFAQLAVDQDPAEVTSGMLELMMG